MSDTCSQKGIVGMATKSERTLRAEARRTARDAQTRRREQARQREKRIEDLAVTVIAAVAERDLVIARTEQRAGEALREMTEREGLSLGDAVEWCGEALDEREAARLRRAVQVEQREAAAAQAVAHEQPSAQPSGPNLAAVRTA